MNVLLIFIATLLPYWQDLQVASVGAETRRTEVVYFASRQDALEKGFRESENYLSLNGVWDFKYYEDLVTAPERPANWDAITVPGNWEVQGWGVPVYTNIPYDFCPADPQPPQLPAAIPGAYYRRRFTVPEAWAGREVYLNLCGTKSGTYVYVNGKEIGYHEDSKSLARYRITDALHKGDNELVLKIFRYTTASFLEDQDFWRISGIERDVYLSSEVRRTGFDFSVVSTLTEDLGTGIFQLELRSDAPTEVYYELIDPEGNILADALYDVKGSQVTLPDRIPGVQPWSAETPVLYTLLLRVNGEYTRFHVGFRRLEIAAFLDGEREVARVTVAQGAFVARISATPASLAAAANGQMESSVITVNANAPWTASVPVDWITVDPASGEEGATEVTVSVQAHEGTEDRSAEISFVNLSETAVVVVNQAARIEDKLEIEPETVELPARPGGVSAQVRVRSNTIWSVTTDASWLSISPDRGNGNGSFTVTAPENEDPRIREALVTVQAGTVTRTVTVMQAAGLDPACFVDLRSESLVWTTGKDWQGTHFLPDTHGDIAYAEWTWNNGPESVDRRRRDRLVRPVGDGEFRFVSLPPAGGNVSEHTRRHSRRPGRRLTEPERVKDDRRRVADLHIPDISRLYRPARRGESHVFFRV